MQVEKSLYERVYIAGLKAKIHSAINAEREKPVSQNTVFLALKDDLGTTPLRIRIREIALQMLQEIANQQDMLVEHR